VNSRPAAQILEPAMRIRAADAKVGVFQELPPRHQDTALGTVIVFR
jgi:hypothetical protein